MEEGLGHLGSQGKAFQAIGSPAYALGATTEDGPRGGMSSDGWRFSVESVALRHAFGVIGLTVANAGALVVVFMDVLLLCALVVCSPYAIWVIYSMFKRRWRRVGLQLAIPGVILLALAGAGAVWYSLQEDHLTSLFDCEVELSQALFKYASERHFNGDGYSIWVYDLPATIRARFDSADQRLLTEYPKSSNIGDRWQTEHWQKTPFQDDFQDGLQLVLSNYDAKEAPELASHLEALQRALDSEGSYYAFFYYRAIDRISDIDFFLVDLANNRLYIVNHNT